MQWVQALGKLQKVQAWLNGKKPWMFAFRKECLSLYLPMKVQAFAHILLQHFHAIHMHREMLDSPETSFLVFWKQSSSLQNRYIPSQAWGQGQGSHWPTGWGEPCTPSYKLLRILMWRWRQAGWFSACFLIGISSQWKEIFTSPWAFFFFLVDCNSRISVQFLRENKNHSQN